MARHREQVVEYRPVDGFDGVETLHATSCGALWKVFHETWAFCTGPLPTGGKGIDWIYRGRTYHGPVGSLFMMEAGEVHQNVRNDGVMDFRVTFVRPDVMERAAREAGASGVPRLATAQTRDRDVFHAFERLQDALDTQATALERESRFAHCAQLLFERYAERRPPARAPAPARAALARVREVLVARSADNVSLEALARIAGLSRFHLLRSFAAEFGLPPHAFQIAVRIDRARAALRRGVAIRDVAVETGFVDQAHFTRHFRRIVGVTPGRYVRAVALADSGLRARRR